MNQEELRTKVSGNFPSLTDHTTRIMCPEGWCILAYELTRAIYNTSRVNTVRPVIHKISEHNNALCYDVETYGDIEMDMLVAFVEDFSRRVCKQCGVINIPDDSTETLCKDCGQTLSVSESD